MRTQSIGIYIQTILAGVFLFLFTYPFYMWEHETLNHVLRIVYGMILFFNYKNGNNNITIVWAILLVYISVAVGSTLISTLVFIFSSVFLLSTKTEFIRITYKTLYYVFLLITILSIINYILFFLGFPMPTHIMDPHNEIKNCIYTAYPFMVMSNEIEDYLRFMGVFDEPGALATYCFLFLWAEKFNFINWKNLIIMIAGFLTLSLFFFIAIGVIMTIKFFSKGTSLWFRFLSIGLVAIFAYTLTIDDSITTTAISNRLEYDDEKGFAGNNRSTSILDAYYEKVRWKEPLFFWGPTLGGVDKDKVARQTEGSASYKRAILECGLMGCLFFIMFFIVYAKKNIKGKFSFLLFTLCFLMTLFQRPFFNDVVFLFLFVSIIKLHNYHCNDVIDKLTRKNLHISKEKPTEASKTI